MPIFECFSVFFCVYLRNSLKINKKKVAFFLKKNLEKCCTIQEKAVYLYQQNKTILT